MQGANTPWVELASRPHCAAMNQGKRRQKLEEAQQAFTGGDLEGAQRLCQSLLRANPADVLALHALAVLASARQDDTAAVAYLSRCTTLDPSHAGYHQDLGRVHALAGQYEAAFVCLQRAWQLKPTLAQTLTDLADVLERSGQHDRAWQLLAHRVQADEVNEDMAPVAMLAGPCRANRPSHRAGANGGTAPHG